MGQRQADLLWKVSNPCLTCSFGLSSVLFSLQLLSVWSPGTRPVVEESITWNQPESESITWVIQTYKGIVCILLYGEGSEKKAQTGFRGETKQKQGQKRPIKTVKTQLNNQQQKSSYITWLSQTGWQSVGWIHGEKSRGCWTSRKRNAVQSQSLKTSR